MDPDEAYRRLRDARVGRLASVRPDGSPHVVPFVFAVEGRTLYWAVDHKPKRSQHLARLANLSADPRVEVVVDGYDEEWSRLWWVRARGRAREVADPEERSTAVGSLAAKYGPYRDRRLDGPVVAVELERWSGWAAAGTDRSDAVQ
jgi:PPOX class probable F420-dependent enzyme